MFADGDMLASKPFAASGTYIDRMSAYCRSCRYNPRIKIGSGACPFNLLYWRFIAVNRPALEQNPRMRMAYKNLDRMPKQRLLQVAREAYEFLGAIDQPRLSIQQKEFFRLSYFLRLSPARKRLVAASSKQISLALRRD
jgi:deoxyribodipyrimidine photolyase-related protein